MSSDETKCSADKKCFWKEKDMTPEKLFEKEWCHPADIKNVNEQSIKECSKNDRDSCDKDSKCKYGSLKEELPKVAFCGVDKSFPYPEKIMDCLKQDKEGCAK